MVGGWEHTTVPFKPDLLPCRTYMHVTVAPAHYAPQSLAPAAASAAAATSSHVSATPAGAQKPAAAAGRPRAPAARYLVLLPLLVITVAVLVKLMSLYVARRMNPVG